MNSSLSSDAVSPEGTYDVVWPKSPMGVGSAALAPRVMTLDGKRIGIIWDYMFRGEEMFPTIEAELRRRFPDVEFVGHETFGNIHGADEANLVRLLPQVLQNHRIDAVIVGNGC
jgi:hypothetical protein